MLSSELKTLPQKPGVYQYFDKNDKLLYVGKAKNLKNRVRSYFSFTPSLSPNPKVSPRIASMIRQATHLEYVITPSESDALILENSFIKQLKPKYNILLRDDKTYPYIYVDLNDEFPRFAITRKVIKGSTIKYFGPYHKGSKEILNAIYRKHKLVQKSSCVKGKKACLFYQIKRCEAPCEGKISKEDYAKIVDEAIKDIKNPNSLVQFLSDLMLSCAKNENYEEAANLRDSINTIKDIEIKVEVDLAKIEDFDVVAINSHENFICSVKFSVREGKISSSDFSITTLKSDEEIDINEAYKQSLLLAYPLNSPITVNKVYVNESFSDIKVLEEIISQRSGKKFSIITPKIGEKRKICDIAYQNAKLNILRHIKTYNYNFLEELKRYFEFENLPVSIEAFDNSHLFGQAPVGGMIAYNLNGFNKANYRHMHLNSNNDYDQMKEALTARALRFDKLSPPDLWVLDGGKAILDLASTIIESSGANVDLIAISKEKIDAKAHRSKGAAKDKLYTKFGEFLLPTDDKRLQFFQKIRDESHRFAISFHQKTRQKLSLQSSKLKDLGLSDGKIKKLLGYFGSFDEIYRASFDEISRVTNAQTAQKLQKSKK